jgi:hypothetical protein
VTDDGGFDAGSADGGAQDAGTVDAGAADAGVQDAGLADAGLMDAGGGDAGTVDAGGVDAGTPDAGPADAGVADAGPACAMMPFPTPCDPTVTSAITAGDYGSSGTFAVTVDTVANTKLAAPGVVSIYRPTGQSGVPVVFFSHAFGATDPLSYDVLFRQLASNGIAVVHVPYAILPPQTNKNAERYDELWAGFLAAVAHEGAVFDLTRVGFAGHSFGGGATPEMARRGFVTQGWGAHGRFMFIMAPWYSWGSGYDTLPLDVRTVVQVYADDDTNDHQIAVDDIWNKLPAGLERVWLMVRSDACSCGLNAGHVTPMTSPGMHPENGSTLNGHDTWAVQRRLHALATWAFTGATTARDVAYGTDSSLGAWSACGGRPVRPLEATLTPQLAACQAYQYPASARCMSADPAYTCP